MTRAKAARLREIVLDHLQNCHVIDEYTSHAYLKKIAAAIVAEIEEELATVREKT